MLEGPLFYCLISRPIRGNRISLRSFRGKYSLVDFWASWALAVQAENHNLLKAYASFKEKGLIIISSTSLDDKKQA